MEGRDSSSSLSQHVNDEREGAIRRSEDDHLQIKDQMSESEHSRLSDKLLSQSKQSAATLQNNRLDQMNDSPLTNANNGTHLVEEPEMV